jgi:hypothetical protein
VYFLLRNSTIHENRKEITPLNKSRENIYGFHGGGDRIRGFLIAAACNVNDAYQRFGGIGVFWNLYFYISVLSGSFVLYLICLSHTLNFCLRYYAW